MDPRMDDYQRYTGRRRVPSAMAALLVVIGVLLVAEHAVGAPPTVGPCLSAPWPTGAPPAEWKGTIQASLSAATPGSVVIVPPADYPGQTITYAGSPVVCTFVDATGSSFSSLEVDGGQHFYLRGATIAGLWNVRLSTVNQNTPTARVSGDLGFEKIAAKVFLWRNLDGLVLRDSQIGGQNVSTSGLSVPKIGAYVAENGAPVRLSTGVVIERTTFHDIIRTLSGTTHAECLFLDAGIDGLTIRDSFFTNCGVFDIFGGGQTADRPITNVLLESNLLDASRDQNGAVAGSTFNIKGGASDFTFRGNSILGGGGTLRDDSAGYPGFVFERNAIQNASYGWIGTATWTGNVMAVPAPGQQQANPVGFVSASLATCDLNACFRNDLHVLADSPAGRAGAGVPDQEEPPPPPPPPPPTCPGLPGVDPLTLTVVAQDATTVTFGWTPPAGADDYVFYADGKRVSWTDDGTRSTAKFAKGPACFRVDVRITSASGGASG